MAVFPTSSAKDAVDLLRSSRGQGICGVGRLFKHSCEPKLSVPQAAVSNVTLAVMALRDVKAGEERIISSVDSSFLLVVRQQELFGDYLVVCGRARCLG